MTWLILGVGAILCYCLRLTQAQFVFAHFMIGNTEHYYDGDWYNDIALAKEAHIDAFALNIAYAEVMNDRSIEAMFSAAEARDFKLFFSFDYAGGKEGPWPKEDVLFWIGAYSSSPAYFKHGGTKPLVSTFEGTDQYADWKDIKAQTNCFFIPSYSSLGAKEAVKTGVVDGLFSWAGWPKGPNSMTTEVDASYKEFLAGKPYMMPVSPWFFTNMPKFGGKNWLWRSDSLWFNRWNHVWYLKPMYVQIISWNDYGESHYIGPVREYTLDAFKPENGNAPFNYALARPHSAWRMFLPYVIDRYKGANPTIIKEGVQAWYRLSHARACSTGGTTGNTASQQQTEGSPADYASDSIFFSALLVGASTTRYKVGDGAWTGLIWEFVPDNNIGLFHASASMSGRTGPVTIEISRNNVVVVQFVGQAIDNICYAGGISNYNPWVGGAWATAAVSGVPVALSQQGCNKGTGDGDIQPLCELACKYDYCPPGACTCNFMGKKLPEPPYAKLGPGYPNPGRTCIYLGMCDWNCNHDLCPTNVCNRNVANKGVCVIPPDTPPPTPPKPSVSPTPTPIQIGADYNDPRWEMAGICLFYKPADRVATSNQCYNSCRTEIEKAEKEGRTTSWGCVSFVPIDQKIIWYDDPVNVGGLYAPGKCTCDNSILNFVGDTFADYLKRIAQIGCFIFMSTLKVIFELGLSAIPGVGQAVSSGTKGLIMAAQLISHVYDASQAPLDAFDFWLSPCGGDDLVPEDLKKAFDILNAVSGDVIGGWKVPSSIPKGSGQKGDKQNPDRDRGPPATGAPTVTKAVTVTVITKSNAKTKVLTRTCSAERYSQACYHYYSAVQNYPWLGSKLSCTDSATRQTVRSATYAWSMKQHINRVWKKYTAESYLFGGQPSAPYCQMDEYPPAYFMEPNAMHDLKNNKGQLVRWLPRSENGGVPGGLWKGFCEENDGGAGNGQGKGHTYDSNLMSIIGKANTKSSGGITTLEYEADYTRAVLVIDYDWVPNKTPSVANDWLLRDNPCWPRDIVPEDPGYVLLAEDKWYSTARNSVTLAQLIASAAYMNAPDATRLASAKIARPNVKRQDVDLEFHLLALEDGELAMRNANTSRRLTEEEVSQNVQRKDCVDRFCSGELAEFGSDENVLLVPGEPELPLPTLPAANVEAMVTQEVKVMPTWTQELKTMVTMTRS